MPRVALILGAGGPTGHGFHAGVLSALHRSCDWDGRDADLIVGTSAGAQIGALLRAGMRPADLLARVNGGTMSAEGERIASCYVRPSAGSSQAARKPAALPYLWSAMRRPWSVRPGRMAAALMREGQTDLGPMAAGLRGLFGARWPEAALWIPAVHLESGRVEALGRAGGPKTDVGTAVAASCAVPSVFAPVHIGERRYVDGGFASANHADLVAGEDFDLVIVSSPLSRFAPLRWLLAAELRRVRQHSRVLLFEPDEACTRAIGWKLMDVARVPAVAHAAADLADKEAQRTGLREMLAD